jgi:hypothetical protein
VRSLKILAKNEELLNELKAAKAKARDLEQAEADRKAELAKREEEQLLKEGNYQKLLEAEKQKASEREGEALLYRAKYEEREIDLGLTSALTSAGVKPEFMRAASTMLKGEAELGRIVAGTARSDIQALMDVALGAATSCQAYYTQLAGLGIDMGPSFRSLQEAHRRDGEALASDVRHAIPLAVAHRRELFQKFTVVVRATVKGNLVVAALQGLLGGLAFWFLDVDGALLWAVVMAFLSLLPAVGAALVWAPVALYFFLAGDFWSVAGLAAWGVLVIGLVDNLLRPLLVGKDTRLPDYLVLTTTLGGMAVFGINGFVLGPAIAAMFVAVWHIYGSTRETEP